MGPFEVLPGPTRKCLRVVRFGSVGRVGASVPVEPKVPMFFLFLYFSKLFFTEIYFRFHNLQIYTPTARRRGGRPLPPYCRVVGT